MAEAEGQGARRRFRRLGYPLTFLSLLLLLVVVWSAGYLLSPAPSPAGQTVTALIPKGASLKSIAAILAHSKLIGDQYSFLILAKLSGKAQRLPAGEFALRGGRRPLALLHELATAKAIARAVTLPEGWTAAEMAARLAEDGWCDAQKYLRLSADAAFIAKLGFVGAATLEGYLYPDTYHLTKADTDATHIITMQTRRFQEVWRALGGEKLAATAARRALILASLVEKEAAVAAERPLIAGVFTNRLRLGMPLQSDPTVLYGVTGDNRPITRTDLERATPYNTYVIAGLPVGPIANPGRDALAAALAPATTDFLYFVAKNDGSHQFSTTLEDHNAAVRRYQRGGK
ncbi:MAG: endolytic transglycosylase MltG [Desulfobulbaceae bacterium]|jgi:UPF0755 protein|nr:endolytic transglycosylase MltG [Desulfobulbaceae bacterium]